MKEGECLIEADLFYFIFALDEQKIADDFHQRTMTAEQSKDLNDLIKAQCPQADGLSVPWPEGTAETIAVYELSKNGDLWNRCAKKLLHCGLSPADLISCREDVYHYLRSCGFTEKEAYRGMNQTCYG